MVLLLDNSAKNRVLEHGGWFLAGLKSSLASSFTWLVSTMYWTRWYDVSVNYSITQWSTQRSKLFIYLFIFTLTPLPLTVWSTASDYQTICMTYAMPVFAMTASTLQVCDLHSFSTLKMSLRLQINKNMILNASTCILVLQ